MVDYTSSVAMQSYMQPMAQRQPIMTPSGKIAFSAPVRSLKDEFVHQHKKTVCLKDFITQLKI